MKKILLYVVVLLFLFCSVSCGAKEIDSSSNQAHFSDGGNWSYIDLSNVEGLPSDNVERLSTFIYSWERNNPDREIVSVQLIYWNFEYSHYIDGISIYSRMK